MALRKRLHSIDEPKTLEEVADQLESATKSRFKLSIEKPRPCYQPSKLTKSVLLDGSDVEEESEFPLEVEKLGGHFVELYKAGYPLYLVIEIYRRPPGLAKHLCDLGLAPLLIRQCLAHNLIGHFQIEAVYAGMKIGDVLGFSENPICFIHIYIFKSSDYNYSVDLLKQMSSEQATYCVRNKLSPELAQNAVHYGFTKELQFQLLLTGMSSADIASIDEVSQSHLFLKKEYEARVSRLIYL